MQVENYFIEVYIRMSNFPFAWWDKTITVYNRYVDPTTQRVSWYRTVVENCFWKYVNNVYYAGNMKFETKQTVCRIPKDDRYVSKREWKEMTNRTDYFTLGNGDIIILGEVDDTVDEYTSGKRSNDLIKKYKEFDECIEVETYVDNTGVGKGLEHYRIVGK